MKREKILSEIIELIEKCDFGGMAIPKSEVKESTDLLTEIGFDSLDKVELMLYTEKHFNIIISEEEENSICKVSELIDLIIQKTPK